MGKKNLAPLAQGAYLQDGAFKMQLTALELLALTPTGVTGSGVTLANVNQRFSLMHPTVNADGKPAGDLPVNYTISVRITRDPIPGDSAERTWIIDDKAVVATEADAVSMAAKVSKGKADDRKAKETEDRQNAIKAAVSMTREMYTEAAKLNPPQNPVTLLQQVAQVAPIMRQVAESFAPKES